MRASVGGFNTKRLLLVSEICLGKIRDAVIRDHSSIILLPCIVQRLKFRWSPAKIPSYKLKRTSHLLVT